MKKRGFGVGKWNGVGGKVKENENLKISATREIQEEIGIAVSPEDLRPGGTLFFRFQDNPAWEQECSIFMVERWRGEPKESDEMRPNWYPKDGLPFEAMWVDDPQWLPLVLAGKSVRGEFLFSGTGDAMLECNVSVIS